MWGEYGKYYLHWGMARVSGLRQKKYFIFFKAFCRVTMMCRFANLSRSAADVQVGNHGDVDLFSARATGFPFCILDLRCR